MFEKKKIKYKYIKRCKGIISIFLCLILTPCLSLISALLEYNRYQNTVQTTREVIDVSTTSTLANIDEYLNDRFGLLSISQDTNINSVYSGYANENMKLLGNAVNVQSITASGKAPLSNTGILKQQVIDFSETTVLAESALKDLNIEEIIEAIENLGIVKNISDLTSKTKALSSSVKNLVEAGNDFVSTVGSIKTKMETVQSNYSNLKNKINALATAFDDDKEVEVKWNEEEKKYEWTYSGEDSIAKYLSDTYENEIKNVVTAAISLRDSLDDFADTGNQISESLTNLKTALSTAKTNLNSLKNSSADSDNQTAKNNVNAVVVSTSDIYKTIIEEMDTAITENADNIKEEVENDLKEAALECVESIKTDLGIGSIKKFSSMSLDEKYDLVQYLIEGDIKGILNSQIESLLPNGFDSFLESLTSIRTIVSQAISRASSSFMNNLKNNILDTIQSLVNAVKAMFNLNVCYDGNLNARLSDATMHGLLSEGNENPYVLFLEGLNKFFDAANKITNLKDLDFVEALKALGDIWDGINKVTSSLVQFIQDIGGNISRLFGYITGNVGELYNDYLLNAYMVHNLPNRLNSTTGTSLTVYPYSDIKYDTNAIQVGSFGGSILGLSSLFEDASGAAGTNEMFKGAELEYILAGTKSEIYNQTIAFMSLYMLRFVLDIVPVLTDNSVKAMASLTTIAAWVVYIVVLIGEPLCDTVLIVNGEEVCLIKKSCFLSPTGIVKLANKLSSIAISNEKLRGQVDSVISSNLESKVSGISNGGSFTEGSFSADYKTHMLLCLMLSANPEDTLTRFANIVQLESNKYYKEDGKSFNINNAYTAVYSDVEIKYNSFMDVFSGLNQSMFVKHVKQQRGY